MSGCERVCLITNRRLSPEPLPDRVEKLLAGGVGHVILREKDLPEEELLPLAWEIGALCKEFGAKLTINSNIQIAQSIGAWGVQLPYEQFLGIAGIPHGLNVGVSVHSVKEALSAQARGAHRVLAGNVFETASKEGLPGKGLPFIKELVQQLHIPVWAVGGILPGNLAGVLLAGAKTVCIMSSFLQADDPQALARRCVTRAEMAAV